MAQPTVKFGFTTKQLIDDGRLTQNDIDLIKSWLPSAQNVPRITDEQIAIFLLSCNLEQEATQNTIKSYYSVKKGAPEVFDNKDLDSPEYQKALKAGESCVFPGRTDDGNAVILYSFLDPDSANWDMALYMSMLYMTLDAAMHDNPPKGLIIVVNLEQMTLMHFTKLRLGLVRTFFQYLQDAAPVKLKCMHLMNSVAFVDKILLLIKPFAKGEVIQQMHFHPKDLDLDWFHKNCLPKRLLPAEFGGDLPTISELHQKNIEKLKAMKPFFDAEEEQRHSVKYEYSSYTKLEID